MKDNIRQAIADAAVELKSKKGLDFAMPEISVERPLDERFGDFSTNVALVLSKHFKMKPMDLACEIVSLLSGKIADVEKVESANPGYINFYFSAVYFRSVVQEINDQKEHYGDSQIGRGIKVDNEFISANPTGPLHLGNGRGGFYGDSISQVLRKSGFDVTNEFYVNDAGGQVDKLGHSVLKDSEAAYSGEYIDALNVKYASLGDVWTVGKKSAADVLENIVKKTVGEKMRVSFDVWMSEQALKDEKYDERAIAILKEKGLTYDSEGATWLRTTDFGDDKDRVLIKSDGKNAYLAGDCGYMLHKLERGYGRLIMGLGADHHGYVSRLKALASALGFTGDFRIIISQLVRLVKDGKEVRMSKRAGNVVLIDDLIDEVGHDVARFFFLMYAPESHMNFDLELAKDRSQKNPVFYVQYAHARICSILSKAAEAGIAPDGPMMGDYAQEKELGLIRELAKFPEMVGEIAENCEVHKLPHYAVRLADKFHSFYDAVRVIDREDVVTTRARLKLANAVKIVLAETLRLTGIAAPERM